MTATDIFTRRESEVRGYCRSFPTTFDRALGSELFDERGRRYIDLFAGAGALNYGHAEPRLQEALIGYLASGRVVHSLDMHTVAKRELLESLEARVLGPRALDWKVMFPGPTGTNAVEAALKLARKVTGRTRVVGFTNGFHGMTLGSLAVTGNATKRAGAGTPLPHASSLPFEGYLGDVDSLALLEKMLDDGSSGLDRPAAVIVETVQAEGGVNVASAEWLRHLRRITRAYDVLLIVDDIQVGCGRTGRFFSFEEAGIEPDIVTLSKSLSGLGLPFALTLFQRDLDVWSPGEHNGTFRGFNPAMVTARAALETFWRDATLGEKVAADAEYVAERLASLVRRTPGAAEVRGRGMIQGVACRTSRLARDVSRIAFEHGVVVETAGPRGEVVKLLPALTIERPLLVEALDVIERAFELASRDDDDDVVETPSWTSELVVQAGAES